MSRRTVSARSNPLPIIATLVVVLGMFALIVYATLQYLGIGSAQTQARSTASRPAPPPAAAQSGDFNVPTTQPQTLPNSAQAAPQPSTAKASDSNAPVAPNFSIITIDNQKFAMAEKQGKVVGVFFSASWCASCLPEANAWGKLYAKYRDTGLEVLIVDAEPGDSVASVLEFKRQAQGGDHAWAIDKDSALVKAFRVNSLDTTIIIGRHGRIVFRDGVPTPLSILERYVTEALQ